jgi:hypothetical protein
MSVKDFHLTIVGKYYVSGKYSQVLAHSKCCHHHTLIFKRLMFQESSKNCIWSLTETLFCLLHCALSTHDYRVLNPFKSCVPVSGS